MVIGTDVFKTLLDVGMLTWPAVGCSTHYSVVAFPYLLHQILSTNWGSTPPTTKMLVGNLALKAIDKFINKMLINLCNRIFTQ